MKRKNVFQISAFLSLLAWSFCLNAMIIWDYSPDTTGSNGPGQWSNKSNDQNFAERFSFAQAALLTDMDIYSGSVWGAVGDTVRIKLWTGDTQLSRDHFDHRYSGNDHGCR